MGQGRRHRDLDAELIRLVRLAFPNAFNLWGMQAEDAQIGPFGSTFDAAQVLVLGMNPTCQHELRGESRFESSIVLHLAADVADDPAEIGFQLPERPLCPVELFGMSIALLLDQRELADPRVGLTQCDAVLL